MVKSIRSKVDAAQASGRIDELVVRKDLNFEEEEELHILTILLAAWEEENVEWPKGSNFELVDTIRFMMDQHGYTWQKDLIGPVFQNKARASEIFNRKRKPTLDEVRNLHNTLRIPYEMII